MPVCQGTTPYGGCNSPGVYKCKKCGNVGCEKDGCTNQAFKFGKCMKCGAYGSKEHL